MPTVRHWRRDDNRLPDRRAVEPLRCDEDNGLRQVGRVRPGDREGREHGCDRCDRYESPHRGLHKRANAILALSARRVTRALHSACRRLHPQRVGSLSASITDVTMRRAPKPSCDRGAPIESQSQYDAGGSRRSARTAAGDTGRARALGRPGFAGEAGDRTGCGLAGGSRSGWSGVLRSVRCRRSGPSSIAQRRPLQHHLLSSIPVKRPTQSANFRRPKPHACPAGRR